MGADHGLFSLYLSSKGHKVLAVENKKGPFETLSQATKHDSNIHAVLSDGIRYLESDINCCCILGMGGITIREILEDDLSKLAQFDSIIISPQSMFHLPIDLLEKNGFFNDAGLYVYEKKYYPIMRFVKGKEKITPTELKYGPFMVKNRDPLLLEMLKKEKETLLRYCTFEDSRSKLNQVEKEIEEIYL